MRGDLVETVILPPSASEMVHHRVDRSEASHAVSLCDMHAKYADVLPTAEILSYFDELPADLFDLPAGSRSLTTPVKEAAE